MKFPSGDRRAGVSPVSRVGRRAPRELGSSSAALHTSHWEATRSPDPDPTERPATWRHGDLAAGAVAACAGPATTTCALLSDDGVLLRDDQRAGSTSAGAWRRGGL